MTNPPNRPPEPPTSPSTLDYARPPGPTHNVWWKVMLRMFVGLVGGVGCCGLSFYLLSTTEFARFWFVPPLLILSALIFVAIKYRRLGYVTGFLLAPFVIGAVVFVLLLMYCGGMLGR